MHSILKQMLLSFPPARRLRQAIISLDHRLDTIESRMGGLEKEVAEMHAMAQAPLHTSEDQHDRTPPVPTGPTIIPMPGADFGLRALDVWRCLKPMDVVGGHLVRRGRAFDGGYIMLDSDLSGAVAYSLGIANDVSWDLEMADSGCQVFQYDHTIDRLPQEHCRFHFNRVGIAAQSSLDGVLISIDGALASNDHDRSTNLVLKMDVEAAEWDILGSLPRTTISRFSQIIIELHWLVLGDQPRQIGRVVHVLNKLNETHQVIHVHANNHSPLGILGGVVLPDALEVTYVRRSDHQFKTCDRVFPTALDMPCNPNVPDYFLGALGHI